MLRVLNRSLTLVAQVSVGASIACFAFIAFAATARAQSLQCNKPQTRCLTDSTQLTIGDKVGIFNRDGELVATGEIQSMRGERRAVLIKKRHGSIRQGYELTLLNASAPDDDSTTMYKVYREPSKLAVGGSLGISTVSVGEGSPATEFSSYAMYRKWGVQLIGRGLYAAMEGEVTRISELGYERLPISVSTFGLLGGAAYTARENKTIAFRGELAAGLMYVAGTVDGEADLIDDASTNSRVKNGFAPAVRGSLGIVWNLDSWHVHGDLAQSLVHQALANTLSLGVSRDLK